MKTNRQATSSTKFVVLIEEKDIMIRIVQMVRNPKLKTGHDANDELSRNSIDSCAAKWNA